MTDEERVRMATIVMVERYRSWMQNHDIEVKKSETGTGLPHAYWMLNVLKTDLVSKYIDCDLWKANRWLGFIQHEIISAGWTSVTTERNYSRQFFTGDVVNVPILQHNDRKDGI